MLVYKVYNEDLPWPDLRRKIVGNPSKTTRDVINIRLIMIALIPNSEYVKAKVI